MINYYGHIMAQLTPDNIQDTLRALGIQSTAPRPVLSQKKIGQNQWLLEIDFPRGNFQHDYVVIDFITGKPSLEQVYRLAYHNKTQSPKVILFSEPDHQEEPSDPSSGVEVVKGLIQFLNDHGGNLNLMEMSKRSGSTVAPIVTAQQEGPQSLPPEKWVRNVEFWHLYFDERKEPIWEGYEYGPDCTGILHDGNFEIVAFWDHTGLGYFVKDRSLFHKNVEAVLDAKRNKLQSLFPTYAMQHDEHHLFEICVTWELIEPLLYASSEKKAEWGRKLKSEMQMLLRFLNTELEYLKLGAFTNKNGLLKFDEVSSA